MGCEAASASLIDHFSSIEDPRDPIKRRHKLTDMIAIAVAGVLCGADEWTSIEAFGVAKEDWFRGFLELKHGIPSHDTFGRVFSLLNPRAFEACFHDWAESMVTTLEKEIIAIDGKSLRGSRSQGGSPLHVVSAWATTNRLVLGQVSTDAKSNEITAIPKLLDTLLLKGCIVTIDAMGCQTKIAEQIIEGGGDYVLALKGNQGTLANEVEEAFISADAGDYQGVVSDFHETIDQDHGRIEIRRYWTLGDLEGLDGFTRTALWKGLNMIGMVHSERTVGGKTSSEYRFYIGSIGNDAQLFAKAVRGHWGIENDLHWSLDVSFREDECRIRERNAAENFAVLRHIALNRLKHEKELKLGIKTKRLNAGWNDRYLNKLLFGASA